MSVNPPFDRQALNDAAMAVQERIIERAGLKFDLDSLTDRQREMLESPWYATVPSAWLQQALGDRIIASMQPEGATRDEQYEWLRGHAGASKALVPVAKSLFANLDITDARQVEIDARFRETGKGPLRPGEAVVAGEVFDDPIEYLDALDSFVQSHRQAFDRLRVEHTQGQRRTSNNRDEPEETLSNKGAARVFDNFDEKLRRVEDVLIRARPELLKQPDLSPWQVAESIAMSQLGPRPISGHNDTPKNAGFSVPQAQQLRDELEAMHRGLDNEAFMNPFRSVLSERPFNAETIDFVFAVIRHDSPVFEPTLYKPDGTKRTAQEFINQHDSDDKSTAALNATRDKLHAMIEKELLLRQAELQRSELQTARPVPPARDLARDLDAQDWGHLRDASIEPKQGDLRAADADSEVTPPLASVTDLGERRAKRLGGQGPDNGPDNGPDGPGFQL